MRFLAEGRTWRFILILVTIFITAGGAPARLSGQAGGPGKAAPANATPTNAVPANPAPANAVPANPAPANPAPANATPASSAPSYPDPSAVFWGAFVIMTLLLLLLFLIVALGLLRSKDWQLSDAVSEEAGNQPNPLPVGTKPLMVASSSRLIALLGLLVILVIFLGFGYYLLYAAFSGNLNNVSVKQIVYFLFSGAVMFAPYLANQLQSAFSAFAK